MTILVTGPTGNVGRHVVGMLVQRGQRVRALTRTPAVAGLPDGVEVVLGDLERPETLARALEGVQALHLFPVPDTAEQLARAARRAGVRRIVVSSCGSAGHGDEHHLRVERAVRNSGPEWTQLRPYGLMTNALKWAETVRTESVVRAPYPSFSYPHVHEADVAAVAVAALLEDGHAGATYTLSGPEALSQLDQARMIGAAIGREIGFRELDAAATHELWEGWGYSPEAVDHELFLLGEFAETPVPPGATVADLLGQTPRTFVQWAAEHADTFT